MLLKVRPADPGNLEIDDQALRKTMGQCCKKISPGFECLYTEATRPKQPTQSLEHGRIIINYGNPGGNFRHERLWRRTWSSVQLTVGPIRHPPLFRDLGPLRHADEIRHRAQDPLPHPPAPMHPDGLFDR